MCSAENYSVVGSCTPKWLLFLRYNKYMYINITITISMDFYPPLSLIAIGISSLMINYKYFILLPR